MELYHGPTAGGHELLRGEIVRMRLAGNGGAPGLYRFTGEIPTQGQRRARLRGARHAVERVDEPPVRDVARSLGVTHGEVAQLGAKMWSVHVVAPPVAAART